MNEIILKALGFSFLQSVFSVFFALVLGFPAGFLVARRKFFGQKVLSSLSVVSLCMPSLLVALSFVLFYGQNGFFNSVSRAIFGKNAPQFLRLYSFWGIVLAHGLYNFPLAMRFCAAAWNGLDANEDDAARICGASERKIFFSIRLPRLLPSIFAASEIIFLYCFFSFAIPLTFCGGKFSTLEIAIYNELREFHIKNAAIFAAIQTAFASFFVFLAIFIEKKCNFRKSASFFAYEKQKIAKLTAKIAVFLFELLIFFFFAFPFLLLFRKGFSSAGAKTFKSIQFFAATRNTFFLSAICAGLAVFFAATFAFFARFRKSVLFFAAPILPLCVSPAAISAFLLVFARSSSFAALIFAESFFAFPLAFKQISLALNSTPDDFFAATQIFSPSPFRVFRFCAFPAAKKAILKSYFLAFSTVAADASLSILLSPSGFETLALRIFRLAGAYRFEAACASGAALFAVCLAFFLIGNKKE